MDNSGRIQLDGDVIRYRSMVYGSWDLPVSDVRIVGEATNQSGPWTDDYFFCFATGPGGWFEASFYAEGRDEFLSTLGARLGHTLDLRLVNSTDFSSRVLWPPSMEGEPMFQYVDQPRKGLIGRLLLDRLMPLNQQTYTERVARVLAGAA